MEWTVYDFECADAAARESLVEQLASVHPFDVPADDDAVHGDLVDADGEVLSADLAWVAEYVYVLTNDPVTGLLDATADSWERAVVATFDSETETCTEAILYHSTGGEPTEDARYEGIEGGSGQGLLYRFAMDHQFRFRAYAHAPPGPMVTPAFGAFDAPVGLGWGSDALADFEHDTGVAPTAQGIEMLEADPVLDEGEFYEADESE
jgi:hypothetical protein